MHHPIQLTNSTSSVRALQLTRPNDNKAIGTSFPALIVANRAFTNGPVTQLLGEAGLSAFRLLVNNAAFHHENDSPRCGDFFKRIAVQRDNIGFVARCNRTDPVAHAHGLGAERVRRDHRAHGIDSGIADAIDEFFGVASV